MIIKAWNKVRGRRESVASDHNALYSIPIEHAKIHEGNAFQYTEFKTVAATDVSVTLMQVDSGYYPHLRHVEITVDDGPIDMAIYENTVVSSTGATVNGAVINANRNSSNTNKMHLFSDPVITTTGDLIDHVYIPSGKKTGGYGAVPFQEIILEPGGSYVCIINNGQASDIDLSQKFYWYE